MSSVTISIENNSEIQILDWGQINREIARGMLAAAVASLTFGILFATAAQSMHVLLASLGYLPALAATARSLLIAYALAAIALFGYTAITKPLRTFLWVVAVFGVTMGVTFGTAVG